MTTETRDCPRCLGVMELQDDQRIPAWECCECGMEIAAGAGPDRDDYEDIEEVDPAEQQTDREYDREEALMSGLLGYA